MRMPMCGCGCVLHEMKHRRAYGSPHDSLLGQSNSSVLTRLSCCRGSRRLSFARRITRLAVISG